jgi:hypothetical protein
MSLVNIMRLFEVLYLVRLWPYDRSFLKPVVAAIDGGLAAWIVGQLLPDLPNLVYLLLCVSVLFGVYLGVILMLGLSDQDRVVLARLGKRLGLKRLK